MQPMIIIHTPSNPVISRILAAFIKEYKKNWNYVENDIAQPAGDNPLSIMISDYDKTQELSADCPVLFIKTSYDNTVKLFDIPVKIGCIIDAVEQIIKNSATKNANHIKIGTLTMDIKARILANIQGQDTHLTEKECSILKYLYQNKDRPVSREELLQKVWHYADGIDTHTIGTHIYRLRQKIEKELSCTDILITDENGYRVNSV